MIVESRFSKKDGKKGIRSKGTEYNPINIYLLEENCDK